MSDPPPPSLRPALSGAGRRLVVDLGTPYRCVSSAVLGGGLGWVRTWLDLEVERPYTRTDPEVHLLEESTDLPGPVVGMLTAAQAGRFRLATVGGATCVTTVGVGHALAAAATRPRAVPPAANGPRQKPGEPGRQPSETGGLEPGEPQRRQPAEPWPREPREPWWHEAPEPQRREAREPRQREAREPRRREPPSEGSQPQSGDLPAAGTINLLVVVDEPLTDAGLVNALQTAVEAKAQALAAAQVEAANAAGFATGTATDSICVACPPGERVKFAGPVTRVGAELALAVLEAVRSGAELDRAAAAWAR
jgi:adenosylcobinamide amidohydrolase